MRQIDYCYSTKMRVYFNNTLEMLFDGKLDGVVFKCEMLMDQYGFTCAEVIDENTGELLVTINEDED